MRNGGPLYRFGPFEFDPARARLRRGADIIPMPGRHAEVLQCLVAQAEQVVTKDALTEAEWRDVAVTDSSIVKAVQGLRETLGDQPDGTPYIETLSRQGYRFVAAVERTQPRPSPAAVETVLAPYRGLITAGAALERLTLDALAHARTACAEGLAAVPDDATAHIGFANACVLQFESTRADITPDVASLRLADAHAREACGLDPSSGEAWSTLAFVRHRYGDTADAMAAARKAVALEPTNWHHHVRLAFVSWGERRLAVPPFPDSVLAVAKSRIAAHCAESCGVVEGIVAPFSF
jgi:DNA-binding winged helix-turn-helix (wHTH) protein